MNFLRNIVRSTVAITTQVIGVSALAHPDLIIEIVAIAALPD